VIAICFLFLPMMATHADDVGRVSKEEATKLAWLEMAKSFDFRGGNQGSDVFDLVSRPILNWNNPIRRTPSGAIYLWTLAGRPQAAMCIYPTGEGKLDQEFQSLSLNPFSVRRNNQVVWQPLEPGIEMWPLETSLPSSSSGPVLTRQMRLLARSFTATLVPPEKNATELRLMPTPVFRYPNKASSGPLVQGGLFAFVQGTDPEVLLMIEAIAGDDQEIRWQYALARMTVVPTRVQLEGDTVWETKWAVKNSRGPYCVLSQVTDEDEEIVVFD